MALSRRTVLLSGAALGAAGATGGLSTPADAADGRPPARWAPPTTDR